MRSRTSALPAAAVPTSDVPAAAGQSDGHRTSGAGAKRAHVVPPPPPPAALAQSAGSEPRRLAEQGALPAAVATAAVVVWPVVAAPAPPPQIAVWPGVIDAPAAAPQRIATWPAEAPATQPRAVVWPETSAPVAPAPQAQPQVAVWPGVIDAPAPVAAPQQIATWPAPSPAPQQIAVWPAPSAPVVAPPAPVAPPVVAVAPPAPTSIAPPAPISIAPPAPISIAPAPISIAPPAPVALAPAPAPVLAIAPPPPAIAGVPKPSVRALEVVSGVRPSAKAPAKPGVQSYLPPPPPARTAAATAFGSKSVSIDVTPDPSSFELLNSPSVEQSHEMDFELLHSPSVDESIDEERVEISQTIPIAAINAVEANALHSLPPPSELPDFPLVEVANRPSLGPSAIAMEVGLGLHSDSNLISGIEGWPTGVFIASYETLPPLGTRVSVTILLPGGVHVHTTGKVVFTKDGNERDWPGVGLAFEQLTADEFATLKAFARFRVPLMHEV